MWRVVWVFEPQTELGLPPGLQDWLSTRDHLPPASSLGLHWWGVQLSLGGPAKEDGDDLVQPSPKVRLTWALLRVWWRQSWGCVQLKMTPQEAEQTHHHCVVLNSSLTKMSLVFMLCHKWLMALGLLAKVCSETFGLVPDLALVLLISKGTSWASA